MTEDEKTVEAGRLVKRYAENKRTIACLQSRLHGAQRSFELMGRALQRPEEIDPAPTDIAYDLMGLRGTPRVEIDKPKLRADISELRETLEDQERIIRGLRQMGLEGAVE